MIYWHNTHCQYLQILNSIFILQGSIAHENMKDEHERESNHSYGHKSLTIYIVALSNQSYQFPVPISQSPYFDIPS